MSQDYFQAVKPIVDELSQKGIKINTVSDLKYRSKDEYLKALPVLLDWINKDIDRHLKEDIVRTLSMPWAKSIAGRPLIKEFKKKPIWSLGWAIGNGLAVVADDSVFEDIVKLVKDKSYGRSREMVVVSLANMNNPYAEDVLIDLLDDEEVKGFAVIALGKLKSKKALVKLREFLDNPNASLRNEVKKAIQKIEKG